MKRVLQICCGAILAVYAFASMAAESESKKPNYFLGAAIAEGFIITDSYLASKYPEPYGIFWILFSPVAMSNRVSDATNMVALVGGEAMGFYNALELKSSNYSESDIFWKNMAIMHGLAMTMFVTEKLTGHREETGGISLRYTPQGTLVTFNHVFN